MTTGAPGTGVGVGVGLGVGLGVGVGVGLELGVGVGVGVGPGLDVPPSAAFNCAKSTPMSLPSVPAFLYGLEAERP